MANIVRGAIYTSRDLLRYKFVCGHWKVKEDGIVTLLTDEYAQARPAEVKAFPSRIFRRMRPVVAGTRPRHR